MSKGLVFIGIAVDPIHPGSGRVLGAVDLPVQRDSLGYPIIYASSVKGALKALCSRRYDCALSAEGRLVCSDEQGSKPECSACCCVFGPEVREGEKGAGRVAVLDIIPLAFPVASCDYGYVYITSPVLLSRTQLVLEAVGNGTTGRLSILREFIERLYSNAIDIGIESGEALVLENSDIKGDNVTVGTTLLSIKSRIGLEIKKELKEVFDKLGGLARTFLQRLVIVSSSDALSLLEKALIKVTRVALRYDRKTVERRALWTEEYIPYGTIFVSGLAVTAFKNIYCGKVSINGKELNLESEDAVIEFLKAGVLRESNGVFYVVVGGKETIGRGLIKFTVV